MSIDLANHGLPPEASRLADDLKLGAPTLGWRGDMRLYLRLGYAISPKGHIAMDGRWYDKGEMVGDPWYEVWRHNEDGSVERLATWQLHELYEIIPDLITMDPRTPGHENIMDRVERHNATIDREKTRQMEDAHGEMLEHMWSVAQEHLVGRPTTRQVGGRDERPDRNLAKDDG